MNRNIKNYIVSLLPLFFSVCIHSQTEVKLITEASHTLSFDDFGFRFIRFNEYHKNIYSGTNISVGIQLDTKRGSLGLSTVYQYGASLYGSPYKLDYHLLGGKLKYRILNREKKVSPLIELSAFTEIASDYRGKYTDGYVYKNYPSEWWDSYKQGSHLAYYYTNYYISTPLAGNLVIGCDFQLAKELYLSLLTGYGFRVIKIGYKRWGAKALEPMSDLSNKHSLKGENLFHFLDFQLGLSYAFSFKKKE